MFKNAFILYQICVGYFINSITIVCYKSNKLVCDVIICLFSFFGNRSLGAGLSNVKYLSEASAAGERIMEVIKRIPKIDSENMEGEILGRIHGEVEFNRVDFAYPSRPDNIILKNFSMKIPAGKTAALVGGSGSGKSTVMSLLQRFYDPMAGEIRVDGVEIKMLQLKWMRSQMGLVSQEPALFGTSIKENIVFGKEDATEDEIVEAAKASNAHHFISQLPLGYDTQVSALWLSSLYYPFL